MDSKLAIFDAEQKAKDVLSRHEKIAVSISGGSDSDVMLDLLLRSLPKEEWNKLSFVFFNTGIEYKATLEHLDELEKKYDIKIERIKAVVPVPLGCKKYGIPFLSKEISEKINNLQNNNFDFANDGGGATTT